MKLTNELWEQTGKQVNKCIHTAWRKYLKYKCFKRLKWKCNILILMNVSVNSEQLTYGIWFFCGVFVFKICGVFFRPGKSLKSESFLLDNKLHLWCLPVLLKLIFWIFIWMCIVPEGEEVRLKINSKKYFTHHVWSFWCSADNALVWFRKSNWVWRLISWYWMDVF